MQRQTGYVYLVSAVAAVGGLLFGYDTAVISGAIDFVRVQFELTAMQEGWVVGCLLIGCIVGTGVAGILSDRYGRKKILIATAVIYGISAIWSALAANLDQLVYARFLGGLAVGVSSLVSPVYIAEIAPRHIRGRLVSLQQMAIVTGILMAFFVNWRLVDIQDTNWRWMFGSESVLAFILLVAMFVVPESPRWLIEQGSEKQAMHILTRVGGSSHAEAELPEIRAALAEEEGTFRELLPLGMRLALLIGIGLAVFSQITGINTIMYYGPKVFELAGYEEKAAATQAAVWIGVTNCLATLIALWVIDKVGRKPLLLIGSGGMAICLTAAAFLLPRDDIAPWIKLLPIFAYIAFFAIGLGATVWVVLAELFPTKVRGRAVSIATMSLWVACYGVAQSFPVLLEHFGTRCFGIFAMMAVVMFVFVWLIVPETKGLSLERISHFWTQIRALFESLNTEKAPD